MEGDVDVEFRYPRLSCRHRSALSNDSFFLWYPQRENIRHLFRQHVFFFLQYGKGTSPAIFFRRHRWRAELLFYPWSGAEGRDRKVFFPHRQNASSSEMG